MLVIWCGWDMRTEITFFQYGRFFSIETRVNTIRSLFELCKKVKALEQGFHVKKSKSQEKNQLLTAHGFPLKILSRSKTLGPFITENEIIF